MTRHRVPASPPNVRNGRSPVVRLLLVAALSLLAVAASQPAQAQPLSGLSGGSLSDADLSRGKVVVVVWATWSPDGRDLVPRVNALNQRWGQQARVVTVNWMETSQEVNDYLRGKSLAAPVFLDSDGSFAKRHALTKLPALAIFDGGRLVHKGPMPTDLDRLLSRHLGGG